MADAATDTFRDNQNQRMAKLCGLQAAYCYAKHGDWVGVDSRVAEADSEMGYTLLDRETLQLFKGVVDLAQAAGERSRASRLAALILKRAQDLEQADLIAWAQAASPALATEEPA